jgi:hypothetical protein
MRGALLFSGQGRTHPFSRESNRRPEVLEYFLTFLTALEEFSEADIFVVMDDFDIEKFEEVVGERLKNYHLTIPKISKTPVDGFEEKIDPRMFEERAKQKRARISSTIGVPESEFSFSEGMIHQYQKLYACYLLMRDHERKNAFEYDYIVRYRPDTIVTFRRIVPEEVSGMTCGNNDIFLMGARKYLRVVCKLIKDYGCEDPSYSTTVPQQRWAFVQEVQVISKLQEAFGKTIILLPSSLRCKIARPLP